MNFEQMAEPHLDLDLNLGLDLGFVSCDLGDVIESITIPRLGLRIYAVL